MRFAAPSAQPTCRVHLLRVCLTRYVPSSGFHALLTASSSTGSRSCFVPERSWSSCPYRAFPSPGAVAPLGADVPSCRSTVRPGPEGPRPTEATSSCRSGRFMKRPGARRRDGSEVSHARRLQGFAPRGESVARTPEVGPAIGSMLSWVWVLSRAIRLGTARRCRHRRSSHGLGLGSTEPSRRTERLRDPGVPLGVFTAPRLAAPIWCGGPS